MGAADAEIKVPSVENLELTNILKFKVKVGYSHVCFAHCEEFRLVLIFSFYLLQTLSLFCFRVFVCYENVLPALVLAMEASCVAPRNKTGHSARSHNRYVFPCCK